RIALADVREGLAGLTNVGDHRKSDRGVVVVDEVAGRPDVLPGEVLLLEDRTEREADRRQRDRSGCDAAGGEDAARHQGPAGHRLAFEVARRLGLGEAGRLPAVAAVTRGNAVATGHAGSAL